ncbi:MAG: dienelactone hydrolase family protein [Armatimonadota bacterium]
MTQELTAHTERYYTALDHFTGRYTTVSRQLAFRATDAADYDTWKTQVRAELAQCIGLPTMQRCDGAAQVVERTPMAGYTREKVLLQTEPGVWMPLYVLIPGDLHPGERRPAVIAPHGHDSMGKNSVAGRVDIPIVAVRVATYNYDYGVQLIKEGFMVFCPDARGFGERREVGRQGDEDGYLVTSSCDLLNHMGYPLGQTVTGMWTWDLMRLADYAESRPECAPGKLGCAGLSGGGLQTLWFAALDDRVGCAVVSGYFYGYLESLLIQNTNCSCNYVPHLWEKVDMGDIGALLAPRALLIETGDADPLNGKSGLANVTSQVEITRGAYALFGAEENLRHHIFPGPHKWCGEQAIPWMKKHLMGC